MHLRSSLLAAAVAATLCAAPTLVSAAQISGQYNPLSGNAWQLSLTVSNDGSLSSIPGFSVYFDSTLFSNLASPLAPATWDPLLLQPIPGIADGLFDAYVYDDADALTPGQSIGGFSLTFDYLGSGAPGALPFEIYEIDLAGNFVLLGDGTVTIQAVPEPASLWLTALGLAALPLVRKSRRQPVREIA